MSQSSTLAPIVLAAQDAALRGLPAVSVCVDAASAGLVAMTFPDPHLLLALSGPPGGPLSVMVWDAAHVAEDSVESVIRARYNVRTMAPLEIGGEDMAPLLGGELKGMTFQTGVGSSRTGWFAALVMRPGGTVLLAFGAGAITSGIPTAAETLQHPSLSSVARSLWID